jgi:hypothetical protein
MIQASGWPVRVRLPVARPLPAHRLAGLAGNQYKPAVMQTTAAFWLVSVLAFSAALVCQDRKPVHAFQPGDGWWAYQPLVRPSVPTVAAVSWLRQPVDAFVLQRLEAAGLQPNPPADRAALLRRVTYDLTGLPPTPAELVAFLDDHSPDAYERVVDRLLASPQYGVQWARHWLDLVRYAETDGYERDRTKPSIWRYRDWVVDALNADMPYAGFLRAQLAGDELPEPTVQDLVATGYYRLGIWDDEPTDPLQARYDDLDGIADTTARAMLGVSMGCARCHDHKKDPLPQRDYYSFLAFFENLQPYDLQAHAVPADGALARHAEATAAFAARQQAAVARIRAAAAAARPSAELQAAGAAPPADLVARYSGDRLHATEFRDEVGEHHGTVVGQIAPIDGQQHGAMRLDGDDHALIPRLVSESFTVSLFVRSDRRGAGRNEDTRWFTGTGLVDGEVPGIVADWGIAWHSDGRVVAGSGAPETFLASPPGYHDGRWHHVAFTRDQASGRIALYVDAVLVGEANGSKRPLVAPPQLAIGRSLPGGRGFRGDLDEITFWRRALTAPEVAALALELPGGLAAAALADDVELTAAFAELAGLRRPELATIEVLAVREQGRKGPQGHVRPRGNAHQQGAAVEPGFPAMVGGGEAVVTPAPVGRASSGRRTALADWITDPANPLTWRVIANRLWQHHFGRGIVRSSNDFGRLGDLPTHPELLDWLAAEVLAQGGSMKAMHRLLVTSATYRMASDPAPDSAARDPQNDWFWRVDRRRLTAEQVRDSMLASSGELNLQLAGPPVYPPLPAMVLATASRPDEAWGRSSPEQAARRSLYVHQKRSLQEPLLAVFDQADTDNSCPVRFATVQATQALTLMNGEFSHRQAATMAARLQREHATLSEQIDAGLRLVTQRPARPADRQRLLTLAHELQADHGKSLAEALQRCCLVMLNCNEFLYLD